MNMDIVQLISSLGFPVAACIGMAWYVKYQTDANKKELKEIREMYSKRVEDATKALHENTLALQKLADELERRP